MEATPQGMKQTRLMQDARTGTLGVTLPSKRRSEPDISIEDESESDEPAHPDYEYISTSLVSTLVRHLNDIEVFTMTGLQVSEQVNRT
jgi:hypothetical protein